MRFEKKKLEFAKADSSYVDEVVRDYFMKFTIGDTLSDFSRLFVASSLK